MSLLQKELEKRFFGIGFSAIKKHPIFKKLDLSNKEIIENRTEIKKLLENAIKCGNDQKFCTCLNKHYSLKRNADQKLIVLEKICTKTKDYKNINKEDINKQIDKYLYSGLYKLDYEEIIKSIEKLENSQVGLIHNTIKKIGEFDFLLKNQFIEFLNKNEDYLDLMKIYAFHYILLGYSVAILNSRELKEICVQNAFRFKKEETESYTEQYQKILKAQLLIIINLGLEGDTLKQNYYLDLLPQLLEDRAANKKTTQIFTSIAWEIIEDEIKQNSNGKTTPVIKEHKIKELNNIIWTKNNFLRVPYTNPGIRNQV